MANSSPAADERIRLMKFSGVYPLYLAKVERKGRTPAEVHAILHWLTGYDDAGIANQIARQTTFETFFAEAPRLNPARSLITGSICGIKLAELPPGLTREVRLLDKLVDELAAGKPLPKILRSPSLPT